jgi:hypothetical protein
MLPLAMAIDGRRLTGIRCSFVRLTSALVALASVAAPAAAAQPALGGASADVSIIKTDSPDPVFAGSDLTDAITVANAGPSAVLDWRGLLALAALLAVAGALWLRHG